MQRVCLARFHELYAAVCQDKQIMGLEIVAVSLGLCTFVDKLRDTKIVIHCDNTGAEVLPLWVHVGDVFFVVIGGGKEGHSKVH